MNFYNKIMLYFWLGLFIFTTIGITYYGFTEGFDRWIYYYVISLIALLMYFLKKFMINRMKKHMKFLDDQRDKAN